MTFKSKLRDYVIVDHVYQNHQSIRIFLMNVRFTKFNNIYKSLMLDDNGILDNYYTIGYVSKLKVVYKSK